MLCFVFLSLQYSVVKFCCSVTRWASGIVWRNIFRARVPRVKSATCHLGLKGFQTDLDFGSVSCGCSCNEVQWELLTAVFLARVDQTALLKSSETPQRGL